MDHSQHDHQAANAAFTAPKTPWTDYIPLGVVVGFILLSTWVLMWHTGFSLRHFLGYSMGFFFLYFSLFKLMDLSGFAHGYHEYDLVAQRVFAWGYVYPFIEAVLAVLYLLGGNSLELNIFTLALSTINCAGIAVKMAKHQVVQCACLGTVLKVPLTKVSLIEYGSMGVMAVVMLFL